MGRGSGSRRLGAGGGMGATKAMGIDNGWMEISGMTSVKLNDIAKNMKPDESGLISSDTMKKAGADINKLVGVGDQLVITFENGSERIFDKTGSSTFQKGQFKYKPVQISNEIAVAKYPNPNLSANKITLSVRRKLSQEQQNAANSIANKVKQNGGTKLKFNMYGDGSIGFGYLRNGTHVLGEITKDGKAKVQQTFNPNFG